MPMTVVRTGEIPMKRIQAASDPAERQRLVEEHMKSMREAGVYAD